MERRFGALNSLSSFFISTVKFTNQTFPYVNFPQYALHVGRILQLTNAVSTVYTPVVKNPIRRKWEKFASSKNDNIMLYINETIEYQRNFKGFEGPMPDEYNWTFGDVIYSDSGPQPYNSTLPFFLPSWHTFPLIMRYYPLANFGT